MLLFRAVEISSLEYYEGQYTSDSYFFSESIITVAMKFMYSMGTSLAELRLFFHKVSFIINTLFPLLCEMLYAGCMKLFAEASELFTHAVFQPVIHKKTSLECIHQWAKNMEVGGCWINYMKIFYSDVFDNVSSRILHCLMIAYQNIQNKVQNNTQ